MGPGKGQEDLQSHRSCMRKCKRTWSAASADLRFLRSWSSAACPLQTHRVRVHSSRDGGVARQQPQSRRCSPGAHTATDLHLVLGLFLK
jgi:hypothetical protein